MIIYYVLLVLFCVFGLFIFLSKNPRKGRYENILFVVSGVLLIALAALRGNGVDRDYNAYVVWIESVQPVTYYFSHPAELFQKDPAFVAIASLVNTFFKGGTILVFAIMAALGVSLKLAAVKRISPYILICVIAYYSNYYLVQEMTQIRAGVASGFILMSISEIYRRNPVMYSVYMLCAAAFHYSALVFVPLYFINPHTLNVKLYGIIIIISFLICAFKIDIIPVFNIFGDNPLTERFIYYKSIFQNGFATRFKPLNMFLMARLGFCAFLLSKWQHLKTMDRYSALIIKIYLISIVVYLIFPTQPVFAVRFRDLIGVVEIFILTYVMYLINEKYALTGIAVVSFFMLSVLLFRHHLINPYFSSLSSVLPI